jgi:hypothetical protein
MSKHETTAQEWLKELRNPDPTQPLITRLRDRHPSYGTDAHLAAKHLDDACALADRAQDYLSLHLANDPFAANLAEELRRFISRVEHVLVPDDQTHNA